MHSAPRYTKQFKKFEEIGSVKNILAPRLIAAEAHSLAPSYLFWSSP